MSTFTFAPVPRRPTSSRCGARPTLGRSSCCSSSSFAPTVARRAEWLVTPGYALPKWYLGGVHDPIQIGCVLILNVGFYFMVFACILRVRAAIQ